MAKAYNLHWKGKRFINSGSQVKLSYIWKNSVSSRWRKSASRQSSGSMYQWADICNGWWGGRKTLSSIRLRRGTSERYPEFVLFFSFLYFRKYFGDIYLRSQANSVLQSWEFTGKSNESNTAGVFAKWRMEISEERSDKEQRHWRRPERCVWNHRTMTSDIWGLNVSRVCQLLLDTGSEI